MTFCIISHIAPCFKSKTMSSPKMIPNIPKLKQQNSRKDIVTYQNQRRVETLPSNIKSYFSLSKIPVSTKKKAGDRPPHQGGAKERVLLETLFFQSSSKSFTKAK